MKKLIGLFAIAAAGYSFLNMDTGVFISASSGVMEYIGDQPMEFFVAYFAVFVPLLLWGNGG